MELNCAALAVKQLKFSNGEIDVDCFLKELEETVVKVGDMIDPSWYSRGWSATDADVATISVDSITIVPQVVCACHLHFAPCLHVDLE